VSQSVSQSLSDKRIKSQSHFATDGRSGSQSVSQSVSNSLSDKRIKSQSHFATDGRSVGESVSQSVSHCRTRGSRVRVTLQLTVGR
jgi:hypothetical protein